MCSKLLTKNNAMVNITLWTKLAPFSSVSIVEFEQVNVCLEEGYYNHVPSTTGSHLFWRGIRANKLWKNHRIFYCFYFSSECSS